MLTRKHFKAAAEKNLAIVTAYRNSKVYTPEQKELVLKALSIMVQGQADWMSRENPNFNWGKFINASGFSLLESN